MRSVLWLAAFLAGCSDFALEKVREPDDVGERELEPDPVAVEFGVVEDGGSTAQTVALVSTGSETVNIDTIEVSGSSAYTISWPADEMAVAPGDQVDVVVTYTPVSYDDQASLVVQSDALEPRLVVPLTGAGLYPAIEVDPTSVTLETSYLVPVEDIVTVASVGTADLVISAMVVEGEEFTVEGDIPATLSPGATMPLTVTYTPREEGETVVGRIWLTTNTAAGYAVVPLEGHDVPPCIGLGEAWDRGLLDAHTKGDGLTFDVQSLAPDDDVCIDQWYVWLSEESQDLGAGDMTGDFGGTYPQGTLSLPAGDTVTFEAGAGQGSAWWCMELTQYTQPSASYTFTAARVPEPLLTYMLSEDQDSVWEWMDEHPAMIAGRWTSYLEVSTAGGSGEVGLRILNMGSADGAAEVRETVPAGYAASGFSPEPDRQEAGDDGATVYVWDVSLEGRELTGAYEATIYDEVTLTYTLTAPACDGRQALSPMQTIWRDSDGTQRSGTANPLIVRCLTE